MTTADEQPCDDLSRRRFVGLLGLLTASAAIPACVWRAVSQEGGKADVAGRLTGLLSDGEAARAIGSAYLLVSPEEASKTALVQCLESSLGPRSGSLSDAALCMALAATIEHDFVDGTTVEVDGWVLSRTEARLAALMALHGPR